MKVFAREIGTTAPYENAKVVAINEPVKLHSPIQDMTVNPGDLIIADLNGVVVMPQELAAQAIPLMRPQVEADEKMSKAIKGGMLFVDASKKFRTTFDLAGKTFTKEEGKGAEAAS